MKKLLLIYIALIVSFSSLANNAAEGVNKKVAVVISGYANNGNPALSYDQEELAQSFLVLHSNGVEIDIITPQGGAVLVKNNKDNLPYIQKFKQSTNALAQLKNTLSAKDASNKKYDALFIVGGDGAMFDLPKDKHMQSFITDLVNEGVPVAAVCHGPAALVNVKLADGSDYVNGKRVNSFTKIEDYTFKKEHVESYPFILQSELESKGAIFESNKPMLPYVAIDENLITAQNPMSVAKAAEALLLKIGITPKTRTLFKDEATFELLSRAYSEGNYLINLELTRNPDRFDLNYMALYGYYAFKMAESEEQKNVELAMMKQIRNHVVELHPRYQLALISANLELGLKKQAKVEYEWLKKHLPKVEMPESLLKKINI